MGNSAINLFFKQIVPRAWFWNSKLCWLVLTFGQSMMFINLAPAQAHFIVVSAEFVSDTYLFQHANKIWQLVSWSYLLQIM